MQGWLRSGGPWGRREARGECTRESEGEDALLVKAMQNKAKQSKAAEHAEDSISLSLEARRDEARERARVRVSATSSVSRP